ncbi:Hachiman antiphage defense system protein HamA [Aquirufa aurantiipilula]|uniref:SAVED domain-containing protein n=1 Tax=Aquirufa aurantiipilula TaxID=2696561 RepID=A0ABT6BM17_9BACT|nr:Hachiman antiphage defense system protein HamA [Aquirufa aurantiipilula]MDF5691492.1 SAVED domain-containing protein [Aquirufa aurantiipilula]
MLDQKDLIGPHPKEPNIFSTWLACNDIAATATKLHRALTPLNPTNKALIEWLGRKIFDHHHSEYRIEKLKENFGKLGYEKYAEQNRKLPIADKTKKGNATEILLTEYIESSLGKPLVKVFKLKYNPNADQAMKGDDTLLIDIITNKKTKKIKIYLGEAKFRKIPSSDVVKTISKSLSKDKKPLSYSFIIDELGRDKSTKDLADLLDTFLIEEVKGMGDIIYTGLLLSNTDTFKIVEANLYSENPLFVLISIGIDDPEDLIKKAFEKAEYLFNNPDKL